MHKNEGLKTFGKMMAPSLMELLSVVSVFLALFIIDQIHQLHLKDLATFGVATFKGTFLSGLAEGLSNLYHSKDFSILAVYIFWLFIALLVYIMALRFTHNAEEVVEDLRIRHYVWPRGTNRNSQIEEYTEKLGIRLIVLVVIGIYLLKLTPALVNWWKLNYTVANLSLHSLSVHLALLGLMILYVHGLVVLARVLLLRLRIIKI